MKDSRKALIVDDDPTVAAILSAMLSRLDFHVITAYNPVDALIIAAGLPAIALVVTDIEMPDMDGIEFARRVRDVQPEAAVVYVSANPKAERVVHAADAWAFFLAKPVTFRKLQQVVETNTVEAERVHQGTSRFGLSQM